jgi:signal peptidase II
MSARWMKWPLVGAVAIPAADQAIKSVVLTAQPHVTVIPGFFAISFATNTGAAFSLFREFPRILTVGGILVLAGLSGYLWQQAGTATRLERTAVSLLMGGAMENLIDRLRLGYVVDYLDVVVGDYHWPTFNLADSAVSTGIACLVLVMLNGRLAALDRPPAGNSGVDAR